MSLTKTGSEGAAVSQAAPSIPHIFHFIWLGGRMPSEFRRYVSGWERLHPDWKPILWTDGNLPSMRNQVLFDLAPELAPVNVGQLRADILRYELLLQFGGVYVDCDFECQKSIEPLLEGSECFAAWEIQDKWLNNAIMGAVPDHPFIQELVVKLPDRVARYPSFKPNVMSGPQFLTQVYLEGWKGKVDGFPQQLFYPYGYNELERKGEEFPAAYAVHHWNNKRSKR